MDNEFQADPLCEGDSLSVVAVMFGNVRWKGGLNTSQDPGMPYPSQRMYEMTSAVNRLCDCRTISEVWSGVVQRVSSVVR